MVPWGPVDTADHPAFHISLPSEMQHFVVLLHRFYLITILPNIAFEG